MEWSNLQDGKCPKCDTTLNNDVERQQLTCPECAFRINNEKFKDITSRMAEESRRPKVKYSSPEEERLSELNNLEK